MKWLCFYLQMNFFKFPDLMKSDRKHNEGKEQNLRIHYLEIFHDINFIY